MKKLLAIFNKLFPKKKYCPTHRGEGTCLDCFCEQNPSAQMCKMYDV